METTLVWIVAGGLGLTLLGGLAAGAVPILGRVGLMLPGVPAPGIVVLLLGLTLTDLPGKRRLIRRIARKPAILKSMNRVRRRFGRADLVRP